MRKVFLWGLMLIGTAWPGHSQFLSWGLEAGVPLNDAVDGVAGASGTVLTNTERWTIGPTVQVHLPLRFSVEVDLLYRGESYTAAGEHVLQSSSIDNWQVPILAKYELHGGLLRPFVDAGVSYRNLSGSGISGSNSAGLTLGGGLTLKLLFLRLSPEIRYTRWNSSNVLNSAYATQSQNQADFLVGFTF